MDARRAETLRRASRACGWWTAATVVAAIGVGVAYMRHDRLALAVVTALLIFSAASTGVESGTFRAYRNGWRDGIESEHYFDDASVLNPVTGKPYGPGPLWAGTEPMDYPDPRCVCGALWLDECTRHLWAPDMEMRYDR